MHCFQSFPQGFLFPSGKHPCVCVAGCLCEVAGRCRAFLRPCGGSLLGGGRREGRSDGERGSLLSAQLLSDARRCSGWSAQVMSLSLHDDPLKGHKVRKRVFQEAGEHVQDARSSGSGLQSQACWSPKPVVFAALPWAPSLEGRVAPCDPPALPEAWFLPLFRTAGWLPFLPPPSSTDFYGRSAPRPAGATGAGRAPRPPFFSWPYLLAGSMGTRWQQ